ncbi:MAG: iron-sulfur cluster co-chaperone HscB C-terminal domain-containing protein [bacterium]
MRRSEAFQVLGVEPRFDLSQRELRAAWMRRASSAHPDAAGGVDESARVNDAMRILSDPIERAQALLEQRGAAAVDGRAMPQEFLLEMMELRERADACGGDPAAIDELRTEAGSRREAAVAEIARLFSVDAAGPLDSGRAEQVIGQINAIRAFDRMIEQLDRESSGGSAGP